MGGESARRSARMCTTARHRRGIERIAGVPRRKERGGRLCDSHPVVRTRPPALDWNEWGFFDYGQVHRNLTAHHCTIADFKSSDTFDAVYSVGAIAHMTRAVREDALQRCRELLRPGGVLLLTADLIPSTDFMWNLSEGREVEPPAQHGTIADVSRQLTLLGFHINEARVHRMVPKSRTDLLFINCILYC